MRSSVGVYKIDYKTKKEILIGCFNDHAFIGQSENADITINEPKISGIHALLERTDHTYNLVDLGSQYGTFKKNKRINDSALTENEPFQLGKQILFLKDINDKKILKQLKFKNNVTIDIATKKKAKATTPRPSDSKIIQVGLYWGEKTLEVRSFEDNSVITLGAQREATFVVAFNKTSNEPFPIAHFNNGVLTLNLPVDASGIVWIDNQVYAIDYLRHHDTNSKEFGEIEVKLRMGDKAHIHFGELSLCFNFITKAEPIPVNWFSELNSSIVKITLVILILLMLLFLYIQLTPRPPAPVKTLADIPQNLKRILYDSGIKKAIKKERAAIGQLAQNIEGGRETGAEGASVGSTKQNSTAQNKNQMASPHKEHTIGVTNKAGLITSKKSGLDIDSVFATNTKSTSINDNHIPKQGPGKTGSTASKLVGNNYGKGTKGIGTGGGGSSVGIGQLRGNAVGGGMGHGDAGLIPTKGLELNSNSSGNGGNDIFVIGGLDSDIISAIIKRYLPQIQNCYEQQLVVSPSLKGKVTVAFTIGPDGSVKDQSIADSSLRNQPIEQCILDKIQNWKFPRPRGGGTVGVKYPFLLMSNRAR